eukprot:m.246139 g.246139  ORF g.246139 m.246139 type:complete len:131 (-) comp26642_c0_seq1:26-418(-)
MRKLSFDLLSFKDMVAMERKCWLRESTAWSISAVVETEDALLEDNLFADFVACSRYEVSKIFVSHLDGIFFSRISSSTRFSLADPGNKRLCSPSPSSAGKKLRRKYCALKMLHSNKDCGTLAVCSKSATI